MTKSGQGHDTPQYRAPRNHCFGCGQDNPEGMRFRIPRRYQGPPGHVHGGIIATILDEAMGKVNKLRSVIALTRNMEVEYLKPVPLGKPLIVEAWEVRVRG